MRIGLVSYEYPPQRGLGGVGTYTFRLAGALGRAGHHVVVLAGPTEEAEPPPQANVTVHRIAARYEPPLMLSGLKWLYWRVFARLMSAANPMVWHWLRWDLASAAALTEIDRQEHLDVIEAPEHAANGLFVGRTRRWPMVVRIHGPWDFFFGINRTRGIILNRVLASLEHESTLYAQMVTAPSQVMADFIHERWRMRQKPRAVPNFMDVPRQRGPLPPTDGPQRIVCAGRLERFKGQDVLVKAFAAVARRHPRAELVLIGPDQWSQRHTFADAIRKWVPNESIRARITLTGPQPLQTVQDELRQAAVAAICSSGFESFSFSTLEPMAAARPIVATRSGAVPELLDEGRCGLLVPPDEPEPMAEALDRLLSDEELRQSLSEAAHARARERYDTWAVLPQFLEVYARAREIARGHTEFPTIQMPEETLA